MKTYSETTPTSGHDSTLEDDRHTSLPARPGFLGQVPGIILTAAIVIGAMVWMQNEEADQRAADLEPVRAQNEALKMQGEETRRDLEATTKLLKDAIGQHESEVFRTDAEIQKLNDARITQLADTIAKKVAPAFPTPQSAAEIEQQQTEQLDKVAARFTENLRPMLTGISADSAKQQTAAAEAARRYEDRIQQLDKNVAVMQTAAQDALKLTHEVSALYLDSFKDQGVLMRLFSLPANLVIDTANLNLVTNRDRAKVQEKLSAKMNELDQRLHSISTTTLADKS